MYPPPRQEDVKRGALDIITNNNLCEFIYSDEDLRNSLVATF